MLQVWNCSYERMCSLVTSLCYRMPRGGGQAAEPEGQPEPVCVCVCVRGGYEYDRVIMYGIAGNFRG